MGLAGPWVWLSLSCSAVVGKTLLQPSSPAKLFPSVLAYLCSSVPGQGCLCKALALSLVADVCGLSCENKVLRAALKPTVLRQCYFWST